MSVSFTPYKASGQRFDLLPGHDDREFSLSNANAADVLDALGIERLLLRAHLADPALSDVADRRPAQAPRPRLPQPSPSPKRGSRGTMLVIECGRPEGYIEQKLAKLSYLVNEGLEIGATHVGWG